MPGRGVEIWSPRDGRRCRWVGVPISGHLRIGRRWTHKGKHCSYINARCETGHFQAKGEFTFDDGTFLKPCRVRGVAPTVIAYHGRYCKGEREGLMKATAAKAMVALLAALLVGGCGSSGGSSSSTAPTVVSAATSHNPKLHGAKILVDSKGFALYAFSKDPTNTFRSHCLGGCEASWAPLYPLRQRPRRLRSGPRHPARRGQAPRRKAPGRLCRAPSLYLRVRTQARRGARQQRLLLRWDLARAQPSGTAPRLSSIHDRQRASDPHDSRWCSRSEGVSTWGRGEDKMSKATTIGPERSKCGFARALPVALLVSLACLLFASPASAAPAWLVPTELSAPGRDASEPALAMGESGETVAVWQRQSETEIGETVQASTRSPGAVFSAPLELSAAAGEPTVAMTPSGEAVAVWRHFFQEEAKGYYAIQASYRPPGGSFSAPLDVAVVPSTAIPQDIHVAIDAAGDTAVVWTQQEESTSVIEASLRPAGASFTAPVMISPTPVVSGRSASEPCVAIDAAGEAVAVWTYDNGTNNVVQAAKGSVGSGFSSPLELSSPGQEAASPSIAASPAGEATAVWVRSNEEATENVIEAAVAPSGGGFSAPLPLSDPAHSAFDPQVASGPGETVAVWTHSDGADYIVEAAAGTAGGFASPVPLSQPGADAERPQVAVDPSDAATVVWQRSNGESEIVQASTGSAAAGFSAPVDLSAPGHDALFPRVAIDAAGDATAVWKRSNGANEIVEAAGYDADAPVFRSLSIPASGMVGVPLTFSVSPFDVWPIASTSFNFGDGANAQGTSVSHTYSARVPTGHRHLDRRGRDSGDR